MYFKDKNKIRNKIAMNGMKKYHKFMNSKQVSNYIIQKTLNIKCKKNIFGRKFDKINFKPS